MTEDNTSGLPGGGADELAAHPRFAKVRKLTGALNRHVPLVVEGFEGTVHGGDKARNSAIESLYNMGVLKPYEEDSYRLNPRLREFLADHFSSYNAFQALQRINSVLHQVSAQWMELQRLKRNESSRDVQRLYAAMDDSLVEIGYSIEHNLAMLQSLLATQYGNVEDLQTKLRQNRYYANQVRRFLADLQGIEAFVERTSDEALACALPHVRALVNRRLGSKLLSWTSRVKDAQATISQRLFEAQQLEAKLKTMSRFALWLARNRSVAGWDVDTAKRVSAQLLQPEPLPMRFMPDVADPDAAAMDRLSSIAARLKPRAAALRVDTPSSVEQHLITEEPSSLEAAAAIPVELECLEQVNSLLSSGGEPLSLLEFYAAEPRLHGISEDTWLVFAALQLRGAGANVEFVAPAAQDPFGLNEPFVDVRVSRRAQ